MGKTLVRSSYGAFESIVLLDHTVEEEMVNFLHQGTVAKSSYNNLCPILSMKRKLQSVTEVLIK